MVVVVYTLLIKHSLQKAILTTKKKIEVTKKKNINNNRIDLSSSLLFLSFFEAICIDNILFVICREMVFDLFLIVRATNICT